MLTNFWRASFERVCNASARLAFGWLAALTLSACTLLPRHATVQPNGPAAPYPYSRYVTSVTWDFSALLSLRRAHGSDIWPCTWAIDGDLYCAWGDGGGFDGDSNTTGRVSLGFARISGIPSLEDPGSFTGRNVWGDAPEYGEHAASFGGKVHTMISVDGVLYAYGSLWTYENTPDPVHHSGTGVVSTLIWSSDLGKTWQRAPWSDELNGSFLNFGQNNTGALDSFVYIHYCRPDDDTHVYLKRVPQTDLTADPHVPGVYEYLTGVDADGEPISWSGVEADAGAIFTDPNGVAAEVVYDAPIGRFLLTSGHNPDRTMATDSAGKVGLFEGPHPWGPWSTVGYYDDWGNLGPESHGDYLGLRFPVKWISADGKTLWAVFSSLGQYDSFNLVKTTLTVKNSLPRLSSPAPGTVLTPGEVVTAHGKGRQLSWSVERLHGGPPSIASGRGASITFSVPSDATSGELVRVTLHGRGGNIYRDYSISTDGGQGPAPRR